jgi:centrosomal protein CEP104
MPRKLQFQVIYSSTADEQHQANELNHHGPFVDGWRSSRLCTYPQELILQFENYARLKRVQLLSHQFLIGSFVDFRSSCLF